MPRCQESYAEWNPMFADVLSYLFVHYCSIYYNMYAILCLFPASKNLSKFNKFIWSKFNWSRLAGIKFCPALPGSRQCYKLFINYILRLHVKLFIPARRDPSFVQPGSRFAGTEFSHEIASARLGGIKKLIKKYP